jgi:lipoprotein-releasing system permease protein
MGYPIDLALRYLGSKKRAFISVGTAFAVLGVALGVAALATVMSVTGGFQAQFRDKVLGVNAHVLVLKYSTDFREYRTIMEQVAKVPGVEGVAPFSINPMMLTHGDATATGVLLKGVDPVASLGAGAPPGVVPVMALPRQIVGCQGLERAAATACGQEKLKGLRLSGAKPPERRVGSPSAAPTTFDDLADVPGQKRPLLKLLEEDTQRRLEKDAGPADIAVTPVTPKPAAPKPDEGDDDAAVDARAAKGPKGDIEPNGGYASVLPADDDVPSDVDPDPCADPKQVAKMPGIVVGVSLAKTLDLELGQCVTVTSPTIGFSFSGGSFKPPVAKRFRVIAVFEAGFDQYDSKLVYTDLYEAQAFYDQGDTVTGVEMVVSDIDQASQISKDIGLSLSSGLYHTMDWEELNHGLFTALRIQQVGMSFVLALIILVAAFTVVATLIMVVLDKQKEIAVLKAMGAKDSAILRIFLYQGGIIGLLGTTIGLVLGFLVCKGLLVYGFPLDPKVYFISHLPVEVRPMAFLVTGLVAIAICLEATVVPSLYAAGLSPVEGFREQAGSNADEGRRFGWAMIGWLYLNHFAGVMGLLSAVVLLVTHTEFMHIAPWELGLFALVSAFHALSATAALLFRRWGFFGLSLLYVIGIGLWIASALVVVTGLQRLTWFGAGYFAGPCVGILLFFLVSRWLWRNWRSLE